MGPKQRHDDIAVVFLLFVVAMLALSRSLCAKQP